MTVGHKSHRLSVAAWHKLQRHPVMHRVVLAEVSETPARSQDLVLQECREFSFPQIDVSGIFA